jgi:deazaflavin-dependent oxidoreductase (nitroreductase family)
MSASTKGLKQSKWRLPKRSVEIATNCPCTRGEVMANRQDWNEHNRKVIDQFRSHGGKVGSGKVPHLLLTTTGARSGLARVNPLNYSTDGDRFIVMASKGGSATHPDWYYNLAANPQVIVEVGAERFNAQATVAEGQERERLFAQHAALMPYFAGFQKKTKRQIPVIILERIR